MRIRVAEESDAEALRAYAEVLFAEDLPGVYRREAPSLEDERAFIRSHVAPANSTLMVAEEDGRIVGIIGFLGHDLPEERHAGELGLSVAEGYRGRGIGTALVEALLGWAPTHGISRIGVRSWSNNPGATRLYLRMRFVQEGYAHGAILHDGETIDVRMMARLLPRHETSADG